MRIALLTLCTTLLCQTALAQKPSSTSQLPAAVQASIKEADYGSVKKVKPIKQRDGSTHYEVEFMDRGTFTTVLYAQDGTVLSESGGTGKGKGKANNNGKGKAKGQEKEKGNKNKDRDNNRGDDTDDDDQDKRARGDNKSAEIKRTETQNTPPPTPPVVAEPPRVLNPTTRPETTRPTTSRPTATRPGTAPGSTAPATNPTTLPPPAIPTTRPTTPSGRNPLDTTPGHTRYIYWDTMPEPVRTAALAQQSQQGSVNAKLLRVQTKNRGSTIYHIPYEKGSISFFPNGEIASTAPQNGGPMQFTKWDDLPEPVRTAALAARTVHGDVNANTVTYQTNNGKTLYYILYAKENVNSYSPDGRLQDPGTFWK